MNPRVSTPLALVLVAAAFASCAAMQELAALRSVRFALDRVDRVRVAGIAVDGRRGFFDLDPAEASRLAAAVIANRMPLEMTVHVRAENPAENRVTARLMRMDWRLFLEDRETLAGAIEGPVVLPPGEAVDVPVPVALDLLEFFRANARDAFDLALAFGGHGGEPKDVRLDLIPAIETGLGPIRYPRPLVVRRTVGPR
jgi:hypothetical protein